MLELHLHIYELLLGMMFNLWLLFWHPITDPISLIEHIKFK